MKFNLRSPIFLGALIAASLTIASGSSAFAACSATQAGALLSCAENSLLACRVLEPTCIEPGISYSTEDTLTAVSKDCCHFTGKKAKQNQDACLKNSRKFYDNLVTQASRFTGPKHRPLKNVITKTRNAVKAFKCSTGSN